jgi:hypothetical protein
LIERPKLGALHHGFRKHTSPSIKWIWRNLSETAPVAPAAEPSSLLYYTSELVLLFLIFFADSSAARWRPPVAAQKVLHRERCAAIIGAECLHTAAEPDGAKTVRKSGVRWRRQHARTFQRGGAHDGEIDGRERGAHVRTNM